MKAVACRPLLPSLAARRPRFFRDGTGLEALSALVRRRVRGGRRRSLRAWVPQCATGEDAYSIAVCLFEGLGNHWREVALRVFATDPEPEALAHARSGRFPKGALADVPRPRRERFFSAEADRVRIKPFVRTLCRFTDHDLSQDTPFSGLDLIAVRGTLAAMTHPARMHALRLYHAALVTGGLLLDPTGSAAEAPDLFAPLGRAGAFASLPPLNGRRALGRRVGPNTETRLRESEDRFRSLFSHIKDAMLLIDDETGLIVLANEKACRLFGWSLAELQGKSAKDLQGDPEPPSEELLGLPTFRREDGTVFPGDVSTSFLMLHGRPCTLQMVGDASSRLLAHASDKREEGQKAFVEDVVHELRSPLSIIAGSAQTLRRGVKGLRARSHLLTFIENHTLRMGRLVDRLLDLSAAGSSSRHGQNPTRVPLAETVWELLPAFTPLAKRRGISLKIVIPQGLAVLVDPADFPHILGNLLDNAIKFTPRGGSVLVQGRAEGREGILSVKDSGSGIPSADLTRIFERFYRCERTVKTKGSGLGLALVRGIAKANRGRVYAENGPAGGTSFHVALPLAPP